MVVRYYMLVTSLCSLQCFLVLRIFWHMAVTLFSFILVKVVYVTTKVVITRYLKHLYFPNENTSIRQMLIYEAFNVVLNFLFMYFQS